MVTSGFFTGEGPDEMMKKTDGQPEGGIGIFRCVPKFVVQFGIHGVSQYTISSHHHTPIIHPPSLRPPTHPPTHAPIHPPTTKAPPAATHPPIHPLLPTTATTATHHFCRRRDATNPRLPTALASQLSVCAFTAMADSTRTRACLAQSLTTVASSSDAHSVFRRSRPRQRDGLCEQSKMTK
jgi:hypothetical protein